MNKSILVSALALSLGLGPVALGSAAFAQSPPVGGPDAKGNAPLKHMHTVNDGSAKPGANSFTQGQAQQHIVNSGYTDVTGLTKGKDGVWRGMASHNGAQVNVAMDFKGNVTEAAGGTGAGAMTSNSSQETSATSAGAGGQGGMAAAAAVRRRAAQRRAQWRCTIIITCGATAITITVAGAPIRVRTARPAAASIRPGTASPTGEERHAGRRPSLIGRSPKPARRGGRMPSRCAAPDVGA